VGAKGVVLFLFSFIPVGLGMAAAALYPQLKAGELALPTVITLVLPTWLGALLLASVFSAEISSADAILFMLSTSLTRDLYQRFVRPNLDDRQVLRAGRILALLSGLAGIGVALMLETVIDALSIFYSLLSASLFVPVFVGLYRATPGVKTCLVAIIAAIVATLATSLATGGAGWGPLSPTAVGIVVSALLFLAAFRRNETPRME
jgi:SSS family solute:Na+ symporter